MTDINKDSHMAILKAFVKLLIEEDNGDAVHLSDVCYSLDKEQLACLNILIETDVG
jgi:hypothetical protein